MGQGDTLIRVICVFGKWVSLNCPIFLARYLEIGTGGFPGAHLFVVISAHASTQETTQFRLSPYFPYFLINPEGTSHRCNARRKSGRGSIPGLSEVGLFATHLRHRSKVLKKSKMRRAT